MKKTIMILAVVIFTMSLFAQPTKYDYTKSYSGKTEIAPCPTLEDFVSELNRLEELKKALAPRTIVQSTPRAIAIPPNPPPRDNWKDSLSISINNYNFALNSQPQAPIDLNTPIKRKEHSSIIYKESEVSKRGAGWAKIVAGVAGIGSSATMVAIANTSIYKSMTVTRPYEFEHTWTEYILVPTYNTIPDLDKCGKSGEYCRPKPEPDPCPDPIPVPPNTQDQTQDQTQTQTQTQSVVINNTIVNYNPVTYTLKPILHTETKTILVTTNETVETERDKTGWYIAAGTLTAISVTAIISGIIDLHNSKVYVSHNRVGWVKNF